MNITLQRRQSGFMLLNLMIGSIISLVITAGMMEAVISMKSSYYYQESLMRMYENGRYAGYFLKKQIRKGGYLGCFSNKVPNTVVQTAQQLSGAATFNQGIVGHDYTGANSASNLTDWSPNLNAYFANGEVKSTTDVLVIQNMNTVTAALQQDMASSDADLLIDNTISPQAGEVMIVTDCDTADIFRASNITKTGNNSTIKYDATYNVPQAGKAQSNATLSSAYKQGASVGQFVNNAFFVASNANNGTSLWQYSINSNGAVQKKELVEGIDDMQILFGEDTDADGSVNSYRPATAVNDWNQVVSIRVFFLLSSKEKISGDKHTYSFRGKTITTADGILRKEFITTIKLRTKGLI